LAHLKGTAHIQSENKVKAWLRMNSLGQVGFSFRQYLQLDANVLVRLDVDFGSGMHEDDES
jgi:hypothetical protein